MTDFSRKNRLKVANTWRKVSLRIHHNNYFTSVKSQRSSAPSTMSSETKDIEHQPFLGYSDDPTINKPQPERQYRHVESRRTSLLSHSLVFVITSLLWVVVLFAISSPPTHWRSTSNVGDRHNITSNRRLLKCGNSTQEARALDCKYDILLNNWVPAPCLDQDFIDEYRDDDSWAAFADVNMTQQLKTIDEMSERAFYYTSVRDHINHCAVIWKKQFWALFEETPAFDTMVASPGHTDHCAQYLMDVTESSWTEPTKVEMGFAGCWIRE